MELETKDFLEILREIEHRGKYDMAHRVAQIAGQVCRYTKLAGIIKINPVEGISELLTSPPEVHFSAIRDPTQIGFLLRDIQTYHGRPITALALQIMPYVFVRSGELRDVR